MSHKEIQEILTDFLKRDYVMVPQVVGNIGVIGLVDPNAPEPIAKSLREAMRIGSMKVVDRGGYTDLTFETNEPVLLRRGEGVVKGGKQDRILQASQIVERPITLGVYCIERSRWGGSGKEWEPQDIPVPIRRMAAEGRDQSDIWRFINEYLQGWNITSRTHALGAIYDALGKNFEKFVGNFEWWKDQVGMVVVINGVASGVEIFDSHDTFRFEGMSLLRDSYIPEALYDQPSRRKLMFPEDVSDAFKKLMDELKEGKRRVDMVQYGGRVVYANVI